MGTLSFFWVWSVNNKKSYLNFLLTKMLWVVNDVRIMICVKWDSALHTKICLEPHRVVSQFSSVQSLSHVRLVATPWTAARQAPCPSPTPGVHPKPCPLSRWCHPIISSSVVPFSSCPHSFPASGSLQMSQLFAWGGQSIGVSALTSSQESK